MSDEPRIRILCVDDHPMLRQGLAALIGSVPDMTLVCAQRSAIDHGPVRAIRASRIGPVYVNSRQCHILA